MQRQEQYVGDSPPTRLCPCFVERFLARSFCKQPQLLVRPKRRLIAFTTLRLPHSHRHTQCIWLFLPLPPLPAGHCAVRRPNGSPVMSLKFAHTFPAVR